MDEWERGRANDQALAEALDITPTNKQITIKQTDLEDQAKTYDDKHDEVRQNLRKLIETGDYALTDLAGVSASSQHPRAYEVLSQLMKTMVEANSKLLEIEKLSEEVKEKRNKKEPPSTVHNNLIVGSTEEALELLAKQKKQANE